MTESDLQTNPIAAEALKTITYLDAEGLLSDEHALSVAVIKGLVDQLPSAATATQYAALTKEIRSYLQSLPHPEQVASDAAQDFLDELGELE